MKMITNLRFIALFVFAYFTMAINAKDIYVDQLSGSVSPDGTLANPYKTIQDAANVAKSGDVVQIKAGVYRETVEMPQNGVTYQAYGSDIVEINGAEILENWTKVTDSVYSSPDMTFNCTNDGSANQLFVNKNMIFNCRWPHQTSNDIVMPSDAKVYKFTFNSTKGIGVITDSSFTEPNGLWAGADIWINIGAPAWDGEGYTAKVLSTELYKINVDLKQLNPQSSGPWSISKGTDYYIFNPTPEGVTAAGGIQNVLKNGEWWKNGSTVYVNTPNNLPPGAANNNLVEAKKRLFAFISNSNLHNRSNITIRKFNLFATSITTDINYYTRPKQSTVTDAFNNLIDSVNAKYVTHFTSQSGNLQDQFTAKSGIILSGINNTIKNSIIQYSSGPGVSIMGYGNKVLNCSILQANYGNTNSGALNTGSLCVDCEIGYSIINNTPLIAIAFKGFQNSNPNNRGVARIHHNKVSNYLRRGYDSGAIDEVGHDGKYLRIDHNEIFNTLPDAVNHGGRFAIYFDFGADPERECQGRYIVDHNLAYNVVTPMQTNCARNLLIYNNTFLALDNKYGSFSSGVANPNSKGGGFEDTIVNNIVNGLPNFNTGSTKTYIGQSGMWWTYFKNNVTFNNLSNLQGKSLDTNVLLPDDKASFNALFTNVAENDYTLKQSATDAIDKGIVYAPLNGNYMGSAPDIGAYESGKPKWIAGAPSVMPAIITPNGGDFDDSARFTISHDNINVTLHYTINGSEPTRFSPVFSSYITLYDTTLLKVRAFIGTTDSSEVAMANFNVTTYNLPLKPAEDVIGLTKGLNTEYYEYSSTAGYTDIPVINKLTTAKPAYTSSQFRVNGNNRNDYMIMRFTGYINAPVSGIYRFYNTATYKSNVFIGNTKVVNSFGSEKMGMIGLEAGKHSITVEYINLNDAPSLMLEYSGSTIPRIEIEPDSVYKTAYINRAAQVNIAPYGGKFYPEQTITLTTTTPLATIHYTTNGDEPTGASTTYTTPFNISTNTTLKAIAIKSGLTNSVIDSAIFQLSTASVVITPNSGTVIEFANVTLSCATPNSEIYYTTDGSEPTTSSNKYTGQAIKVYTTKIRAMAVSASLPQSNVTEGNYIIKAPKPIITPGTGVYKICSYTYISISSNIAGSVIYYTTNGNDPTTSSPVYTQAFKLPVAGKVKAITKAPNMLISDVAVVSYLFDNTKCPDKVKISPDNDVLGEEYICNSGTVTLTCGTAGVTIYYTSDGTEPTDKSTIYSQPFIVEAGKTVKAIAKTTSSDLSDVSSVAYKNIADCANNISNSQASYSIALPNPANGGNFVIIPGNNFVNKPVKLQIINVCGQTVYQNQFVALQGQRVAIQNAANIKQGMYFVTLNSNGTTEQFKLIVK